MTLRVRAKVLLQGWSYDFYDTTLSTKKKCKLLEIMVFMSYSESKLISSYYFIKVNI